MDGIGNAEISLGIFEIYGEKSIPLGSIRVVEIPFNTESPFMWKTIFFEVGMLQDLISGQLSVSITFLV